MGKKDNGQKHSAPIPDTKVSPPSTSDLRMPSSISDLVEATNLSSTLNATSGQDAVVQIVTHPVMLALLVGVSLLVLNRR
jgi:hypothetical protein